MLKIDPENDSNISEGGKKKRKNRSSSVATSSAKRAKVASETPKSSTDVVSPIWSPEATGTSTNEDGFTAWWESGGCRYRCATCAATLTDMNDMCRHLRREHGFKKTDSSQYEVVRKPRWPCPDCGKLVLKQRSSIRGHLGAAHGVALSQHMDREYRGKKEEEEEVGGDDAEIEVANEA